MKILGREILLLRIAVPLLTVAGMGAGESPPVLGNAPPSLGGDAPPKVPLLVLANVPLVTMLGRGILLLRIVIPLLTAYGC